MTETQTDIDTMRCPSCGKFGKLKTKYRGGARCMNNSCRVASFFTTVEGRWVIVNDS